MWWSNLSTIRHPLFFFVFSFYQDKFDFHIPSMNMIYRPHTATFPALTFPVSDTCCFPLEHQAFLCCGVGCGIPLEDLPHVFDRFYKVDKSRGLAKDSFGLGLYIVRTLVNRHGQEIYARSSPGEYAEFTFALKLDKQKNDPETVARLAEQEEDTRLQ